MLKTPLFITFYLSLLGFSFLFPLSSPLIYFFFSCTLSFSISHFFFPSALFRFFVSLPFSFLQSTAYNHSILSLQCSSFLYLLYFPLLFAPFHFLFLFPSFTHSHLLHQWSLKISRSLSFSLILQKLWNTSQIEANGGTRLSMEETKKKLNNFFILFYAPNLVFINCSFFFFTYLEGERVQVSINFCKWYSSLRSVPFTCSDSSFFIWILPAGKFKEML